MNITHYPNELLITERNNGRPNVVINYEGQQGLYNRSEWSSDLTTSSIDGGSGVATSEVNDILDALNNCSNDEFYSN